MFTRDPGFFHEDLRRHLAVSADDVLRVLRAYVIGKPAIVLSTVPAGKRDQALSESTYSAKSAAQEVAHTTDGSPLDRTKKPGAGSAAVFRSPAVWHGELGNGVRVIGTPWKELPFSTLSLSVPAGHLYETPKTLGLSSLTAAMMQEGTRSLSAVELAQAIEKLGATINVGSSDDEITFNLSCLDKNLAQAVALLGDMLTQPRFADEDFKRIQKKRLITLDTRADQITLIADEVYQRLLWGPDSVAGASALGTKETLAAFTIADVKSFWHDHVIPNGARLAYVGKLGLDEVRGLFAPVATHWKADAALASKQPDMRPPPVGATKVYLVDKAGAAQSEIRIGHPSVASTDPDYYALTVLNYPLGGAFSSRVNLNLREDKGYTYGARTGLSGGLLPGAFTASAGVKTDTTKPSVVEFMKELVNIKGGVTDKELAFTKDALVQGVNRQYESTRALLGMLESIGRYGYPDDFVDRRLKQIATITKDELKKLAEKYFHPEAMVVLVVGDKATVGAGLAELGYGTVTELDIDGKPIVKKSGSN